MNDNEYKVRKKYEKMGYDVVDNSHGAVDLICFKEGEPPKFIEVKYHQDWIRESQINARKIIKKHGYKFMIERIPKITKSNLLKESKEVI